MKKQLFQVAVLLQPTKQELEDGGETELLVPVTMILAKDQQHARDEAIRLIDEDTDLSTVEILVRPF